MSDPLGRPGLRGWLVLAVCAGLVGIGAHAYRVQLAGGIGATGLHDGVVWGVYVAGFLVFLGIASAAALTSAVLRLASVPWRGAVTRVADLVTVAALTVAALLPIADLGRPDRVGHLLRHGRWDSPALWDVFVLVTFLVAGLCWLYVGLIPDLAASRDRPGSRISAPRRWLYRAGSVGWVGQPAQRRHHRAALRVLALLLVPVALTVPTIVTWVAAMTLPGGAAASLRGSALVVGTMLGGIAVLVVAMAAMLKARQLPADMHRRAFIGLGCVMAGLAGTLVALTGLQRLAAAHGALLTAAPERVLLAGTPLGWLHTAALLLPLVVVLVPAMRRPGWITLAAALAAAGMAVERYAAVVGGLALPRAPGAELAVYTPTWIEYGVTAGAVGLFGLLLAAARMVVPAQAAWEFEDAFDGPSGALVRRPGVQNGARRMLVAATRAVVVGAVTALGVLAVWPGGALAHPQREVEEPAPAPAPPPSPVEAVEEAPVPSLRLYPPFEGVLGEDNIVEAVLLAPDGTPIVGAPVTFSTTAAWGTYVHGEVRIGTARTDERGYARILFEPRRAGHAGLAAAFAGDADHQPASAFEGLAVLGTEQLYTAQGPTPNQGLAWLAAGLLAAWAVMLTAAGRVVGIAHSLRSDAGGQRCPFSGGSGEAPKGGRRQFLSRYLLPAGMAALVTGSGAGVLGLLGRSAQAAASPPARGLPVAAAGEWAGKLRPLPPLLEREVSFADEVLPILLRRGGPHVHPPKNSPVPFHVHLDSYEGLMEGHTTPGHEMAHALVEPGDPGSSRLVTVLRDPSMQMPPGVPLPDEEIQLITTWVAQGAKDN